MPDKLRIMHDLRTRFLIFSWLGLAASAWAGGLDDPLATGDLAPLKPSPRLSGRVTEAPCRTALPGTALTVTDVIDLTLCNNPQTREVWANARLQAAQVGVAQAAWLPGLDGKLAASRVRSDDSRSNQRNASLTASWLLFDFGARSANLENARQLLNAAAASQDATVQAIFLSALQAYYTAQAARAALDSAREAEKASRESFAAAEVRYKVGSGTPADRLQAQTAYSQATLTRIKAEGEVRNTQGALANAMGFDANQPLALADIPAALPDTAFEREMAALIEEARQRRPDLKAAEAQVKAAEAGIELARAQGRPTVSFAAGPNWQDVGGLSSSGGSLGVNVTVPIFSGFSTTYKVRAAEAQMDVKAALRDRVNRQVALDVWRAYQSLATAGQSLKASADLVISAEQSERVALGRYKAGVGTVLDVLNAQSALAAARLQRIQAGLDWYVFRATLAQSMGALDYSLLPEAAEGKP